MMGLAGKPGTDVLPTCSIRRPSAPRALSARAFSASNVAGHSSEYGTTAIGLGIVINWGPDVPGWEQTNDGVCLRVRIRQLLYA